jgi:lipoyl(octanoyl) transferase
LKFVLFEDIKGISYKEALDLQTSWHDALISQKLKIRKGELLSPTQYHKIFFCEHRPVFTLGKSGTIDNLLLNEEELTSSEIEFFKINRGGDITYHGPGQITGYPILDLEYIYTDIHRYIRDMEEAIINTIAKFGISGERIDGYTGVWIKSQEIGQPHRKICAIGVHMSRWVSLHGFALNVNTDLSYFQKIIPCGINDEDKIVTSLSKELNKDISNDEVKPILLKELCKIYDLDLINL